MSKNIITKANDNIFIDLGFSAEEADNLLIRSQLMLALLQQIKHHGWTIDQTAQHLKQSNDQIVALTQGKIGQFSIEPNRKVRLFCPFTDEQPIRIYYRQDDEHGSENVISVATLVDRLKWFNQA